MGSVVDSLKRLYRKIGGGKLKGPIAIDDLVDKIADQMSSGGSGGSGSGSEGPLLVHVNVNEEEVDGEVVVTYSSDATSDEIDNAFLNNRLVMIVLPDQLATSRAIITSRYYTGGSASIVYSAVYACYHPRDYMCQVTAIMLNYDSETKEITSYALG